MLFASLLFAALALTCTMFITRQAMLGFPSAIFWALFGGWTYTLSAGAWSDIYYYTAFASLLGMVTFSALGAYGLREKRDTIADDEIDEEGTGESDRFVDEKKDADVTHLGGAPRDRVKRRLAGIRERARVRRGQGEFR